MTNEGFSFFPGKGKSQQQHMTVTKYPGYADSTETESRGKGQVKGQGQGKEAHGQGQGKGNQGQHGPPAWAMAHGNKYGLKRRLGIQTTGAPWNASGSNKNLIQKFFEWLFGVKQHKVIVATLAPQNDPALEDPSAADLEN